jgi:hypothetical protein
MNNRAMPLSINIASSKDIQLHLPRRTLTWQFQRSINISRQDGKKINHDLLNSFFTKLKKGVITTTHRRLIYMWSDDYKHLSLSILVNTRVNTACEKPSTQTQCPSIHVQYTVHQSGTGTLRACVNIRLLAYDRSEVQGRATNLHIHRGLCVMEEQTAAVTTPGAGREREAALGSRVSIWRG